MKDPRKMKDSRKLKKPAQRKHPREASRSQTTPQPPLVPKTTSAPVTTTASVTAKTTKPAKTLTPARLREEILSALSALRVPVSNEQLDQALQTAASRGDSPLALLEELLVSSSTQKEMKYSSLRPMDVVQRSRTICARVAQGRVAGLLRGVQHRSGKGLDVKLLTRPGAEVRRKAGGGRKATERDNSSGC